MPCADNPVISIVVPVYNMAAFIGRCLESILSQGYPRLQLIVIDGGSTDGTVRIIERFSDRIDHWVSEPDRGQSHAINKGFARAGGDVLAWLNADEAYLPGVLSKVAGAFAANGELDFVYGNRLDCDERGNIIRRVTFARLHPMHYMLYYGRVLPTDASFWSARVHRLTGVLDEDRFQHLAMDYDWLLRLSMHVRSYRYLNEPLSRFTQHAMRKTVVADESEIRDLWLRARRRVIREHRISRLRLLCGWLTSAGVARFQLRRFQLPRLSTAGKILSSRAA